MTTNPLNGQNQLVAVQSGLASVNVTVSQTASDLSVTQSQLSTLTTAAIGLAIILGGKANQTDLSTTQASLAGLTSTVTAINRR